MRLTGLLFVLMQCAVLAPALSQGTDDWPSPPSRENLVTDHGTITVSPSSYVYGSTLQIDGAEASPIVRGLIRISYAYHLARSDVALISIDTGDAHCAVHYRWIALSKSGYKLTEPFGSCSPLIRIQTRGSQLLLQTPSADQDGEVDTWVYNGKTIKRR